MLFLSLPQSFVCSVEIQHIWTQSADWWCNSYVTNILLFNCIYGFCVSLFFFFWLPSTYCPCLSATAVSRVFLYRKQWFSFPTLYACFFFISSSLVHRWKEGPCIHINLYRYRESSSCPDSQRPLPSERNIQLFSQFLYYKPRLMN